MRFRTPAFAFIVEALTGKHKSSKENSPVSAVAPALPLKAEVAEIKVLPAIPPEPVIPRAPRSPKTLATYEVDEESAKYLSAKDIHDLKQAFSLFDADGTGVVNAMDLGRVMQSLGQEATYSELTTMMSEVCDAGKGGLTFPAFMKVMAQSAKADKEDVELRNAFKLFDLNSDGFIDVQELKHVVHTLGNEVTDEEAAEIMREHDLNGHGKINYEEFVTMMTSQ